MHGRLKIKEKKEIEQEKKIKFEKKCKIFKAGLDKCLEAKSNDVINEEIIKISFDLLAANPDIYTLWNLRKEWFLNEHKKFIEIKDSFDKKFNLLINTENDEKLIKSENQCAEQIDDLKTNLSNKFVKSKNDFIKLCNIELDLTKIALTKNEKSYCAWQHRYWVLTLNPEADFKQEFDLCDFYLQRDGRNFHCWDYRTLICKLAKRDLIDEINFSREKIEEDFSSFSYSNLYYRSLILTKASKQKIINFSEIWNKEYEMIENALFTEPSDQAYWFYLKWLLSTNFGKCFEEHDKKIDNYHLLEKIIFNKKTFNLIFYFEKSIECFPLNSTEIVYEDKSKKIYSASNALYALGSISKVWSLNLDDKNIDYFILNSIKLDEFQLLNSNSLKKTIFKDLIVWENEQYSNKNYNYELKLKDNQLEHFLILLKLEKNNKWLNMMLSHLTKTDQIQILEKLKILDPLRKNYYCDQISKVILLKTVLDLNESQSSINLNLSAFYFPEKFSHLTILNLSGNNLVKLNSNFNCLFSIKELVLDDNQIFRICRTLEMRYLEILFLQRNKIESKLELDNLQNCSNLKKVYLFGNPIANNCDGKKIKTKIIITFCEYSERKG